jgi:ADP-ribosylglycohydrolase
LPADGQLIGFHLKGHLTQNGLAADNLLHFSDGEIEQSHTWVQWMFPSPEPSQFNRTAPTLSWQEAIELAGDARFIERLENSVAKYLGFLSRNNHWLQKQNHNHLRISRIILSLRILHSTELAGWFFEQVRELASAHLSNLSQPLSFWRSKLPSAAGRVAGAFIGLAVGDALGAPVEFHPRGTFDPVTEFRSGGLFNLPAGAWTDDTAMALSLAESLLEYPNLEQRDLLDRFCRWASEGYNSSTGKCVGIGQNTLRTLGQFHREGNLTAERHGSKADGNGAIMRLAPCACMHSRNPEEAARVAVEQSRTTHASPLSENACAYMARLLCALIEGKEWEAALHQTTSGEWFPEFQHIPALAWRTKKAAEIQSSGFVMDTIEAALWSVDTTSSFEEAVLNAVNLGDDADTVGAVAGQIAGARYGLSAIPEKLKQGIAETEKIYVLSQFLNWKGGGNGFRV